MKDSDAPSGLAARAARRASYVEGPAIQVICLGSGGGPSEDNVTGFLVRSTASKWAKGSLLAVDAGSHLAAITRILQEHFPLVSEPTQPEAAEDEEPLTPRNNGEPAEVDGEGEERASSSERELTPSAGKTITTTVHTGAFAGLAFPHTSARANAVHVVREHVSTYLITHPHLDHVSGFVINTAAFHNTSRPKRLAALPSTVNAIKTHIFNDIIWPNLTDEDGGVGFVTFQRLAEGGNIALGEGPGSGFIEVCDGLGVKGFKVSHGHCMRGPSPFVHRGSIGDLGEASPGIHQLSQHPHTHTHPHPRPPHIHHLPPLGRDGGRDGRSSSISYPASQPGTPLLPGTSPDGQTPQHHVIDSTAYFIRSEATSHTPAREILVFGDVEPDSISMFPRTFLVWREAAPKIAQGILAGVFIECSYNNSQGDAVLFGHLAPRHVIQELQNLAQMVREERVKLDRERDDIKKGKKRKRASNGFLGTPGGAPDGTGARDERIDSVRAPRRHSSRLEDKVAHLYASSSASSLAPSDPHSQIHQQQDSHMPDYALSPPLTATSQTHFSVPAPLQSVNTDRSNSTASTIDSAPGTALSSRASTGRWSDLLHTNSFNDPAGGPLNGLKVVIIHVKDSMADGRLVGESILEQLRAHEAELQAEGKGLGCDFFVCKSGESFWF